MNKDTRAFSLVEVVLALGVVSVALVSMMAMLPIGLGVYKRAQAATVESEIVCQISNDLQNSPYSSLFDANGNATTGITGFIHYYDVEGRDITAQVGAGGAGTLPRAYTVTLSGSDAMVGGVKGVASGSGLNGPVSSGGGAITDCTTTNAGGSVAQTVQIKLACGGATDIFSILVVNKGY